MHTPKIQDFWRHMSNSTSDINWEQNTENWKQNTDQGKRNMETPKKQNRSQHDNITNYTNNQKYKKNSQRLKIEKNGNTLRDLKNFPSLLVTVENYDQNPPNRTATHKETPDYLFVASLNVRTLLSDSIITEINYAIKELKWDVIGICEVRRQKQIIAEYPGFILCHSEATNGKYGVGFLIKKHLKKKHSPTEACSEDDLLQFYETIEIAIDEQRTIGTYNC